MMEPKQPGEKLSLETFYTFRDPRWLELALTHKSYANERRVIDSKAGATGVPPEPKVNVQADPSMGAPSTTTGDVRPQTPMDSSLLLYIVDDNERLEFLGDAVLSAALSARLMREFPTENEGALSKRRASLVNEERLAHIATRLGLHELLRLGKGEIKTGGAAKPRILACGLEALIGAMYFDSTYVEAERVINQLFEDEIRGLRESTLDYERDYKTRLQEWSHEERSMTPNYALLEEFGPAHSRGFRVAVSLGERELARGEGKSKKAAEQEAARAALKVIATEQELNVQTKK